MAEMVPVIIFLLILLLNNFCIRYWWADYV